MSISKNAVKLYTVSLRPLTVKASRVGSSRLNKPFGTDSFRILVSYGSVRVVSDSRAALHPCESLSSLLPVSDCPAVAQQQSRGVLAQAAGASGDEREAWEGAGQRRRKRSLTAAS